ncbi:MAG: preprotein translocase subunit SecB [Alkaliphilus sp.]
MDSKKVIADFQLIGHRVAKFNMETGNAGLKSEKAKISYDIDYNVINYEVKNERHCGEIEFHANITAKSSNDILFDINLKMEGLFIGNIKTIDEEQFINFLELNGVATLSHLSRTYIISVSSLSGLNPPAKLPMININSLRKYKKEIH